MQRKANPAALKKVAGLAFLRHFVRCIPKSELSFLDELVLNTKYAIRHVAGSKVRWYGLDTSSLVVETVPFIVGVKTPRSSRLERV